MSKIPEAKQLDFNAPITSYSCDKGDRNDNNVDKVSDDVLKKRLSLKADKYIRAGLNTFKYQCFEFEEENKYGELIQKYDSMLRVPDECIILFEGSYIKDIDKSVADYIFHNIVGFNPYSSSRV